MATKLISRPSNDLFALHSAAAARRLLWPELHAPGIGIIGSGKLGSALAQGLLRNEYPKESICVSCRGSPSTLASLARIGLHPRHEDNHNPDDNTLGNVTTNNQDLARRSKVILLCLRAQDIGAIHGLRLQEGTAVMSFVPGISLRTLQDALGQKEGIFVGQTCGPDTILERRAMATMYPTRSENPTPQERTLRHVLGDRLGMELMPLPEGREDLVNVFTAGMCLGPAFLVCDKMGVKHSEEVDAAALSKEFAPFDFGRLYRWAMKVRPRIQDEKEIDRWIRNHCTEGGVTESIVRRIEAGGSLVEGLKAGIQRGIELGAGCSGEQQFMKA
ncbi:hypothetical protein QOT17_012766 [Balamuthia mandrillaris]